MVRAQRVEGNAESRTRQAAHVKLATSICSSYFRSRLVYKEPVLGTLAKDLAAIRGFLRRGTCCAVDRVARRRRARAIVYREESRLMCCALADFPPSLALPSHPLSYLCDRSLSLPSLPPSLPSAPPLSFSPSPSAIIGNRYVSAIPSNRRRTGEERSI